MTAPVTLAEFRPEWVDSLVTQWRASFENAVGVVDPHPIEEQRNYFTAQVLPKFRVRVALIGGGSAGFVAASDESIAQLYVWRDFQGQGIGPQMLDWAKRQSAGALWLYTFEQNRRACAFYEKHGFVAAKRGFEPHWQLADVRYEWHAW